jgi:hypothetical protein
VAHRLRQSVLGEFVAPRGNAWDAMPGAALDALRKRPLVPQGYRVEGQAG